MSARHTAPGAGARNGTASTHTRSPGPATGRSGTAFFAWLGAGFVVRLLVVVLRLAVRRRRPGMDLPLVPGTVSGGTDGTSDGIAG
jgi:hypothetical protein